MNIINKVTLEGLKKNRTRTIVTIIGVILSAAMLTAVTTLITSMQNYMINITIADEGDWHGAVHGVNYRDAETFSKIDEIDGAAATRSAGYAELEGSKNDYKPYLYIWEFDQKAFDMLSVYLTNGRLPQNENEIVVSEHILTNGDVNYQIGDTLTLDIGKRISEDGTVLWQKDDYVHQESGMSEKLEVTETRTFTIVGICDRLSYTLEGYSAPGYTVITMLNREALKDTDALSIYIKAKQPKQIYGIVEEISDKGDSEFQYNNALLRYMGASDDTRFNSVLYGLGTILIILIMVGSISLIYNSFSISVSERKKQFGLLSGAGATSKQLRNSVLFEAFTIAGIGVPIGIISGILGISVTLHFIDSLFAGMISSDVPVSLTLSVSISSIAIAILAALATILISAYIPGRRSAKMSAIDAIRQTTDIKLTGKQVKTSRLTRRIFGIEGDLALKNMKRNRRRYRSTVVSLFISVVLFVSVSGFSMYLKDSVTNVYEDTKYDISYYVEEDDSLGDSAMNIYDDILALDSVDEGAIIRSSYGETKISKDHINESYYKEIVNQGFISDEKEDISIQVDILCVDHDTFTDYIRELRFDESQFTNTDSPAGIMVDKQHYYDANTGRYRNTSIFKEPKPLTLSLEYGYGEQGSDKTNIQVAAFAETAPFGISDFSYRNTVMLIIDEEIRESTFAEYSESWNTNMYFVADDPFRAEADMEKILLEADLNTNNLYNVAEMLQSNRNIITIISVLSYGFIILISLITIANVFNTISTNVNLRRREFAMLKSVGMTNESFNRMLNFECIFYGLKALFYGLPVSILVTYLIYQSVTDGVDMAFYLPVQGILISILSVFLVVFISMMYSMSKIRKENILDALKNENL